MLIHCLNNVIKCIEKHSQKPSKETAYRILCYSRMVGVQIIKEYINDRDMSIEIKSRMKKASKILPKYIKVSIHNPYEKLIENYKSEMSFIGNIMFSYLDEWQRLGGTFEELCNLCNISIEQGRKLIRGHEDEKFSGLIFVSNLDYKNLGDFLEDVPEAPFTVSIKEFVIEQLVYTEHGKKAAHEALQNIFPELLEKSIIPINANAFEYTDEYGQIHRVDEDGVEI